MLTNTNKMILEGSTNKDDRIECGDCHSVYSTRRFLDGKLNYACPVCEQKKSHQNESVVVDTRKILHD